MEDTEGPPVKELQQKHQHAQHAPQLGRAAPGAKTSGRSVTWPPKRTSMQTGAFAPRTQAAPRLGHSDSLMAALRFPQDPKAPAL